MVPIESGSETLVPPTGSEPEVPGTVEPDKSNKASEHTSDPRLNRLFAAKKQIEGALSELPELQEDDDEKHQNKINREKNRLLRSQQEIQAAIDAIATTAPREGQPTTESKQERPKIITPDDRKAIHGPLQQLYKKIEAGATTGDEALQLTRQLAHLKRAGIVGGLKNQEKVFKVLIDQVDSYRNMEQPLKLAKYLTYLKYMGAQETIDQGDAELIRFAIQTQIDRGDAEGLSQLCMYAKFIGAQEDFSAARPILQEDFKRTQATGDAEASAYELARRKFVGLPDVTAQSRPLDKTVEGYQAAATTMPDQTLDSLGINERLGELRQMGQWREFARLRLVADYLRGPRGLEPSTRQALEAEAPKLVSQAREKGRWAIPVSYLADVRQLFRRTRDITPRELTDLTKEEIEQKAADWAQGDRPLPDPESVLAGRETKTAAEDTDIRAGDTMPLPKVEAAPLTEDEASARYADKLRGRRDKIRARQAEQAPEVIPEATNSSEQPDFLEAVPVETAEPVNETDAPAGWWQRVRGWLRGTSNDAQGAAVGGRAETGIESPDERLARITTVLNEAAVTTPSGEARSYTELITDAKQHGESLEQWAERYADIASRLQNDFLIPPAEAWDAVTVETTEPTQAPLAEEINTPPATPPETIINEEPVVEEVTTPEPAPSLAVDTEPAIAPTPDETTTEPAPSSRWPRELVKEWQNDQREAFTAALMENYESVPMGSRRKSPYEDIVYYQAEQGLTLEKWHKYAPDMVSYMEAHDLPPEEAWIMIAQQRKQSRA